MQPQIEAMAEQLVDDMVRQGPPCEQLADHPHRQGEAERGQQVGQRRGLPALELAVEHAAPLLGDPGRALLAAELPREARVGHHLPHVAVAGEQHRAVPAGQAHVRDGATLAQLGPLLGRLQRAMGAKGIVQDLFAVLGAHRDLRCQIWCLATRA
ncbi:hypothetical protein POL25_32535 [Nannocystis sp. bb15-2]|uniref:Uncharacterized protein n=1 Tax=Nannocystis bainbridge TaxID=2995303 RepID=A0ABT5E9X6_9BACT|nr:hypothetical protein [Nannocystis bainbridge]MDC0721682.1 hypothetical protein [Nannocystis bainbridge]